MPGESFIKEMLRTVDDSGVPDTGVVIRNNVPLELHRFAEESDQPVS
jgi:hypothetical protein